MGAALEQLNPCKHSGLIVDYANVFASLEKALARKFQQKEYKKTELDELKALIAAHLAPMVELNPTRANHREKFEALIASYNAGRRSMEETYNLLLRLSQELSQEQQRHIRENLSEEELAMFDILLQSAPELSVSERAKVKQSARELVEQIKQLLVLNWQQKGSARSQLKRSGSECSKAPASPILPIVWSSGGIALSSEPARKGSDLPDAAHQGVDLPGRRNRPLR